ncbi:MAG: hypothetical protein GIW94_09150 [Candidatus Eremiobacteraeota bacterium]|nr:hypothetical protein [Candidatus Eremiobacteraeota bacterium]MBC5822105.1 hypothetical protein [Candidatus Eremiobacteraeota bacterium]
MLEGSRGFDIAWGLVTGSLCFALGATMVACWLRARRSGMPSSFGAAVDPHRRLQLAYGIFALVMGGTNYGCRFIDHRYLAGVHEGYFALTLTTIVVIALPLAVRRPTAIRVPTS